MHHPFTLTHLFRMDKDGYYAVYEYRANALAIGSKGFPTEHVTKVLDATPFDVEVSAILVRSGALVALCSTYAYDEYVSKKAAGQQATLTGEPIVIHEESVPEGDGAKFHMEVVTDPSSSASFAYVYQRIAVAKLVDLTPTTDNPPSA